MLDKIIGVYKITNLINGKIYIGSSIDINSRWKEHVRDLNKNKHHSTHLQRSWNKNGSENFEFSILEKCNEEEILDREQYYLDTLKPFDKNNGYNTALNSLAPMTGRKHSNETKAKLSEGVRNRDASVWVRGEDKFNAKFKDEDIIEIKKLISEGCRIVDIANLYNVEGQTITQIKTGERWSHIVTEYDDLIIQTPRQKLTEENVIEIKKLLIEEKLTIVEIADIFNVSFGIISSIKNLNSWGNIGIRFNNKLNNRALVKKLNKNTVKEIKRLLMEGKSCKEISGIYNVHPATISNINQNKIWENVEVEGFLEWIFKKSLLNKISKNGAKIPVIQLSMDGEFIKEWSCALEISEALNIDPSGIAKCCRGKQRSSKGYKWVYKSDFDRYLEKEVG